MDYNDIFSILSLGVVLFLTLFLFVKISVRLRKRGGSMTTVTLGATDSFYHSDKKRAVEVIMNKNAGKKTEEQSSADPKDEE